MSDTSQAATLALNDLAPIPGGFHLRNPRHEAEFTAAGLDFVPRQGGPEWHWQLTYAGSDLAGLPGVALAGVQPSATGPGVVAYPRGVLIEEYRLQAASLKQQFVIPQPLALGGANLVLAGVIRSSGSFAVLDEGWEWRDPRGAVRLGEVAVYDASGRVLPAAMQATAASARIVVDGAALAGAAYPVTIDPEIGVNDFRISTTGADGDPSYDALDPATAYNGDADQYLVVWSGAHTVGEYEIFGKLLNADGTVAKNDFRISIMGTDGDSNYNANTPAVVYNNVTGEYLVVWSGDTSAGLLVDNEFEIYGQRLRADGAKIAGRLRFSSMGPDGDPLYDALDPAVTYNSDTGQYLVAWAGDDNTGSLVNDAFDIFVQLLDPDASETAGFDDLRICSMGPDNDPNYDAANPAVAYNSRTRQYLVVWEGDDNRVSPETGTLVDEDVEIFGQRLTATGGQILPNDFRISHMGVDADPIYNGTANNPAIAYDSANNRYLVVWEGAANRDGMAVGEREIFGDLLDAQGSPLTAYDDFRISYVAGNTGIRYGAFEPSATYNAQTGEYLVTWRADPENPLPPIPLQNSASPAAPWDPPWDPPRLCFSQADDEFEIYGQRISAATGRPAGRTGFAISMVGPCGNANHDAASPAVVAREGSSEYLVAWEGDPTTDGEFEIYGQRISLRPFSFDIADQATTVDGLIGPIYFPIGDEDQPSDGVVLEKESSDPTLLPPERVSIDASQNPASLVIDPIEGQSGVATVMLTLKRNNIEVARDSFKVTVVARDAPPWLVMLYLAGDDRPPDSADQVSLSDAIDDLVARLRLMDGNPTIALAVLADGSSAGDGRLYRRDPGARGLTELPIPGEWLDDKGDLDTGSPATLRTFVTWAREEYPGAPRSMLAIVGHGGGWAPDFGNQAQPGANVGAQAASWRGMAVDLAANSSFSTRDMGIDLFGGLAPFDVLFFDACLMGMAETAYQVAPFADYLVAGQNLLWSQLPYPAYLALDAATPNPDAEQLAVKIVERYNQPASTAEPFTIAALDLKQLRDKSKLATRINTLADRLLTRLPVPLTDKNDPVYKAIKHSYDAAQKFDYDSSFSLDPTDGYVDLADFARQLLDDANHISSEVDQAAQQVLAAVDSAVIATRAVSGTIEVQGTARAWNFPGAKGLSIYLPLGERDCRPTGDPSVAGGPQAEEPLCVAPPNLPVGAPMIEPQLKYYADPTQLKFTEDAPAWAALLVRLDSLNDPRDPNKPFNLPFLARSFNRVHLPLVRR